MQLAFRAREVVNLRTLNLFLDVRGCRQHRRHGDVVYPQMSGYAAAEFQSGQRRYCA